MTQVTQYHVLNYGTADGYQGNRAQIQLMDGSTVLGWIRFHDPGMPFPNDTQAGDKIIMHLPSAMFENVLDILRNEKPINYYFAAGHAFLGTSSEPVGEAEGENVHPECPHLPADLPVTRPPIPYEWAGNNWFPRWSTNRASFETIFMNELRAYPPVFFGPGGFHGQVPFCWGYNGVMKGVGEPNRDRTPIDEIYGDTTQANAGPTLDAGLLDAVRLDQERIPELRRYIAEYNGVTKFFPYIDLGTQLYGNHDPDTETGFWEFYNHWHEYAIPRLPLEPDNTGPFDLGPKPPNPTTWLRKWHNLNWSSVCQYPNHESCASFTEEELVNFRGLSFFYSPKQSSHGSYYHYAVCLNTEGWELWWKQVIQWIARVGFPGAFVDNVSFGNCWNQECQIGYCAWLANNFSKAEIVRLFTVATSLYRFDPSFEGPWHQENGRWWTDYAWAEDGGRLYPDVDSWSGLYSARLEGPGKLCQNTQTGLPPEKAGHDFLFTVHYKTAGNAQATLFLDQIGYDQQGNRIVIPLSLPNSPEWRAYTTPAFQIPDTTVRAYFQVGDGTLWVDELWLTDVVVEDGVETTGYPTFKTELAANEADVTQSVGRLRIWAADRYWNSVVDEKILYLRKMAREINPDFQIFTNSYFPRRGADYFAVEGQVHGFESSLQEVGHPPGLYSPDPEGKVQRVLRRREVTSDILNTNIFDYKYTYSLRLPDFFGYHIHLPVWGVSCDPVTGISYYEHNCASALLAHVEVAAFGGGAGVELGLRQNYNCYRLYDNGDPDDPDRLALRDVGRDFFNFVADHRDLYECLRSYGEVALVFHDIRTNDSQRAVFDLAQRLARRGVLWDILTENRTNAVNFARYKALIYHHVQRMSEAQAQALIEFMNAGGLVIASGHMHVPELNASGEVGELDEFFRLRAANRNTVWPPVSLSNAVTETHEIGSGRLIWVPHGIDTDDASQVITWIEDHFVHSGSNRQLSVFVTLPSGALERMRVAAWAGQERLVLHLVNYNVPLGKGNGGQVQVLANVEVKVKLPGGWEPSSVRLYAPADSGSSGDVEFSSNSEGLVNFVIPSLHIYEIAVIS